jgi:signal transduction histidine kinase
VHSLYWRIFLSFWLALALILIGTVSVVVNGEQQRRFAQAWLLRSELYGQATEAFETAGPDGLRAWLTGIKRPELSSRTFILDSDGNEMLGRSVPNTLLDTPPDARHTGNNIAAVGNIRGIGGPLVLVGPGGKTFHVVIGPLRAGPHLFGELETPAVSTATLFIALVVSAAVCFFLARYLVAPVDQLRRATRQIASGDLDVKVSPKLKGRQDELGLLASDLDTMSERVRNLLELKQQLLRDVSHELRSPLARLQLALSLARRQENSGVERQLARIACEADRLEELIARTLKLARLERPMQGLESVPVDLAGLLTNIVGDVGIEAEAHGSAVALQTQGLLQVNGDPELLRSALENVIRNALRYGPPGSRVEIEATRSDSQIDVTVRDSGPGVPEKDLELIFEPFYRVDAARNRSVGGDGLGLAIAARAVSLHGGRIQARNLAAGGLAVQISLPAMRVPATPASGRQAKEKPPQGAASDGAHIGERIAAASEPQGG